MIDERNIEVQPTVCMYAIVGVSIIAFKCVSLFFRLFLMGNKFGFSFHGFYRVYFEGN